MEPNAKVKRIGDYILGPMLGKGAFSHVRVATRLGESAANYAIKYMKVGKPYPKEYLLGLLQQELTARELDHPNILKIYGVSADGAYEKLAQESKTEPVVYAVLQLARSSDLFDFVIGSGEVSERVGRWYFIQLLGAVEYLHTLGFAHRDIKPANVLLDRNYCPLLTDFGLSIKLSEIGFTTSHLMHRVGTEKCMTPELYAGVLHSPTKDDLFALGYTLFMLITRCSPFSFAAVTNDRFKLLKENRVLEYWRCMDPHNPPKFSSDFKSLLTLMLAPDITIRPSISEIRAHPWMRGEVASQGEIIAEFEKRQEEAIKFQRKEAEARRIKKIKNEEKTKQSTDGKRRFGPHLIKRDIEFEENIVPTPAITKVLSEFGNPENRKPTILMSQETPPVIERTLLAFFSLAKSIDMKKDKYKVKI